MNVRKFKQNNAQELRQLFYDTIHAVNSQDYTPEQLNAWAPVEYDKDIWQKSFEDKICFVVEAGEQLVGFGDMTSDGYVNRLFVHKDFQGLGVASRILDSLEKEARILGISLVHTEASITAKPFFEKRGFVVIKEQQKLHKGYAFTNYIMEKRFITVAREESCAAD